MVKQGRMASVVLLACAAYLLGSLGAFGPGPGPAEADPDEPETCRLADVAERLAKVEDTLRDLVEAHEEQAKRLEPLIWLADQLREARGEPPFTRARENLRAARLSANETAAIATLRNFVSAQAQVQQSGKIDVDSDGVGEYAGFLEMSAAAPGRMSYLLFPPVLAGTFRVLTEAGAATRSGYCFRIFLPDHDGRGVGEPRAGYDRDSPIEPDLAERFWCCYAWPVERGVSGRRAFFTNQNGSVLACDTHGYSAQDGGPAAHAAFRDRGDIRGLAGGGQGSDGNIWMEID